MSLTRIISEVAKELSGLSKIDRENIVYTRLIKEADKKLKRLAVGSARRVYDFKDNKVVKVAMNAKGIAQNEVECDLSQDQYINYMFTKMHYCAENYSFLIAEKAEKITKGDFKSITGVDFDVFEEYIRSYMHSVMGKQLWGMRSTDTIIEEEDDFDPENEFVYDIVNMILNYGLENVHGDMIRISSYGKVMRDGQPDIVIVDYGLNQEVFDAHYAPKRKNKYR